MSALLDRPAPAASQLDEAEAVTTVLTHLLDNMKPKAQQKARTELEAYADRLETWKGCRLPANVTPLRGFRSHREMALANEAQRQERAQRAAAIRSVIGRAF